mmetsp:Transcript_33742/g.47082  ORF Transcript_33742/g.47082 Transcript_33742/m.47082 type:complete len:376 (-) Transcript_33742:253-1380(-)
MRVLQRTRRSSPSSVALLALVSFVTVLSSWSMLIAVPRWLGSSSGIANWHTNQEKIRAQEAINRVNKELTYSLPPEKRHEYNSGTAAMEMAANSFSQQISTVKMDPETLKRAANAADRINQQLQMRGVTGAGVPMPFMQHSHEIDINDVPWERRTHLTMTATHMRINKETGSVISILGRYVGPEELKTEDEKRLRLRVSAVSAEMLDAGVNMVYKLINDGNSYTWAPGGGLPFSEKVTIDIPNVPGFNLKYRIIGPQGGFIKYIEERAGIRVFLRGRGSGFIEGALGREMEETMFLYLASRDRESLELARVLARNLIDTVAQDFVNWGGGTRGFNPKGGDAQRPYGSQDNDLMTKLYGEQLYAADAMARAAPPPF